MDQDKAIPQPIQPNTPPVAAPVVVHKSNNVPLVGAIIFLALVIGAAAVYFGMQKKTDSAKLVPPTEVTPSPTTTTETPVTLTPTTEAKLQSYSSTKLKDNSMVAYSISYPQDWTKDTKRDEITDTLTLTKGEYVLKIYQAPVGGGGCTFKGDPPAEMSQDFSTKEFVEIKNSDTTFRRVEITSAKPTTATYTFCANTPTSKTTFGAPTSFGAITYTTPVAADAATLSEMDKIVTSLKAN